MEQGFNIGTGISTTEDLCSRCKKSLNNKDGAEEKVCRKCQKSLGVEKGVAAETIQIKNGNWNNFMKEIENANEDITSRIGILLVDKNITRGVDPSAHAFDRMAGQMKKDKPVRVKGSPSDEKKRMRDLEKARKEWDKEEKEKKYGYNRKN